jgi:hypothetical protein
MKNRYEKTEKLVRDSIDKMMEIAGHKERYNDLVGRDGWYAEMTMTKEQNDQWRDWFVAEAKSVLKWSKTVSLKEFSWLNLMYGLKIEEQ